MAGKSRRAERAALLHQALGEVVHAVLGLFALLGLARHLPVPGLDAFLLHGQRSVDLLSRGDREGGTLVFIVAKETRQRVFSGFLSTRTENKPESHCRNLTFFTLL